MDKNGWVSIAELIDKVPMPLTRDDILRIVSESDKQRFALSGDGLRIRANQGHSIDINLNLEPVKPPDLLFHGTAMRFVASIRETGLVRKSRQFVHLSQDRTTATGVGQRHGKPTILVIRALDMHLEGFRFFVSENGVWLTDVVPSQYIDNLEI